MKRIIALLIVACTLFTFIPVNAFANGDIKQASIKVSVSNKSYDGQCAQYQFTPLGFSGSDFDSSKITSPTGKLSIKDAGSYTLSASDFEYNDPNYNVTFELESSSFTISPKGLTVSGTTVESKTYDRTKIATVKVGTVSGIIDGDDVSVTAEGTFENSSVGTGKIVNVTYKLSGKDASNYATPDPITRSANILQDNKHSLINILVDVAKVKILYEQTLGKYNTDGANIAKIVMNADKNNIDENDKALILANTNATNAEFVNITLNFQVDDTFYDLGKTNETLIPITYNFDFTGKENVKVVRVHDGEYGELTTTPNKDGEFVEYDKACNTIEIKASKYSTYAIVYDEVEETEEVAQTGDNNAIILFVAIAVLSVVGFVIIKKKTK